MENKEKFEDIMRARFAEKREIPFDEPNWENIKDMLSAAREKRKRRRIGFIFFFGLLSGIVITIPFILNSNTTAAKTENKTTNVVLAETNRKLSSANENQHSAVTENKTAAVQQEKTPEASTIKSQNESVQKIVEPATVKNATSEVKTAPLVLTDSQTKKQTPVQKKRVYVQTNISPGFTPASTKEKNVVKKEVTVAKISAESKQVEKNNSSPLVVATKVPETKTTEKQIVNESVNNKQSTSPETTTAATTDTSKTAAIIPPVTTKIDSLQKKTDTTAVAKNAVRPENNLVVIPPEKNIFSLEAGTGYALGWNYGDTIEGRGFNPLLGIAYTRMINSKWSLRTGLQATSIGHLTASSHTIKNINCNFGYNSSDTIVATNWLYYLTVPVQLQYNLNAKNQIGFGGTFSYLINGSGKLTTYSQTDDAGITGKKESSQIGYVKGFNAINASILLSYTRRFSDRFSAGLVVYYSLTDLKNNSFFNKQKIERDMGLKLILTLDLFKK